MWHVWNIHHRPGRDPYVCVHADSVLCVGQMKDSPGAIERWKGQVEDLRMYSSYQDAVGIDGEVIEFEWKIPRIFIFVYSSRDPERPGEKEHPAPGVQGPNHLPVIVQWHCVESKWWELFFRMPIESRITRWNSRTDIEHSWVQGRKRSCLLKKENGILQPTKWYSDSKKLVILCSKVSVPWVVESWGRRKVRVPLTSMEIRWTQNSFKSWPIKYSSHKCASLLPTSCGNWEEVQNSTRWRTITPLCGEYSTSRSFPQSQVLAAVPEGTILGPMLVVQIVKTFDGYEIEVAIPSIAFPANASHAVISRETKQSALWMKFMITKKSSSPVTNCSQLKRSPIAARKLVRSIASRKLVRAPKNPVGDPLCKKTVTPTSERK